MLEELSGGSEHTADFMKQPTVYYMLCSFSFRKKMAKNDILQSLFGTLMKCRGLLCLVQSEDRLWTALLKWQIKKRWGQTILPKTCRDIKRMEKIIQKPTYSR